MAYLDIAAICSKVEELVFKLRGRLPVDILTDQVHKFVGVLVKIKHFCAKFSLLRAGIQGKVRQKLEGPMKWEKYAFICYTGVIAQKSCLNRSWHSHGAWPVEVHVCEFVGELLDVGGLHLGNLSSVGSGLTPKFTEHDEVGRRHGALQVKD